MSARHPSCFPLASCAAGLALIATGVLVDASFVARNLSPDGILDAATVSRVALLRALASLAGALLCLWSFADAFGIIRSADVLAWLRRHPQRPLLAALCALVVTHAAWESLATWPRAQGAEYRHIALALADGHGFSQHGTKRWYFYDFRSDESEYPDAYFPTALEEPLYPALLGGLFRIFGERGALVMFLLHAAAHALCCLLVYRLGRGLAGRSAGLLASFALAAWPPVTPLIVSYLGPAPIGGLLVAVAAVLLLACLERPTIGRAVVLGGALGVSALTLASTTPLVPLCAALVLWRAGPRARKAWIAAGAIVAMVVIVIAPWTIRNWLVFGELVPVRTGFGLLSHQGNPIIAGTYFPGPHACTETLGPLWRAGGPSEALALARRDRAKEWAIYRRSYECVLESAPEGFESFNEVRRDGVYASLAFAFIKAEPGVFAHLVGAKLLGFARGWSWVQSLVASLALAGIAVTLRLPEARALALVVLAFAAPYALGLPWGYRYRYPIEPLLLVFACSGVVRVARRGPALLAPVTRSLLRRPKVA